MSRMEPASNLRLIALASVVALIALVPLAAATAGPPSAKDRGLLDVLPVLGTADDAGPYANDADDAEPEDTRQTASCGPRLSSPEGLRAQTCTISEDGDTWARTYFRNTTGEALSGVLTLMRPDGRTVQVDCPIGADERAGSCETPRERTVPDRSYAAVAEIARAGENADRLLLRAGSGTQPEN
ncbi:hypothetical protein OG607_22875 [Streptomyces sp. NBC_01537]|uniref:hypothetical protein n=1 Tax=Streptomyces sp. NBC_01537 TaxID=2903896 RepID=UPI00387049A1